MSTARADVPAITATLAALNIYPVKSCGGIALESARLGETGLVDDRHWMLVRPNGRFVTQRELPRMALIGTAVTGDGLTLDAPHMPEFTVARDAGGEHRAVTVWKFTGRAIDGGDRAAEWVSKFLDTPLRLVRFDSSLPRECNPEWTGSTRAITEFADGYPVLVMSRASLDELNSRLAKPLPMERFRPNLVIDGVAAYDEDRIHELSCGEVTLRLVKPCTRCAITTTDQRSGSVDGVEPLATLKTYRYHRELMGVAFGQNAIVVSGAGSTLRVGARFDLRWKTAA